MMPRILRCPVSVSYSTVSGSQAVMVDLQGNQLSPTCGALNYGLIAYGDTMWNALATEMRRERMVKTTNFIAKRKGEQMAVAHTTTKPSV